MTVGLAVPVALGPWLRAALTPRALAAWAGTDRLSALPIRALPRSAATPASALFALLIAGARVRVDPSWPALGDLVELDGGHARARVAVLPLGRGAIVCDRLDADPDDPDTVCWPDDSSYHLALSLPPGRRESWLDLGCGSAFAPVLRPELAQAITGTDLVERAACYARLGLALSNIAHADVASADLADGITARYALVSCNAPIPGAAGPRWRSTQEELFVRLFAHAGARVEPGGVVVVHGELAALAPIVAGLPGERVVVAYTPADDPRGFAIAWWRPDAPPRHVFARRLLTPERPHLTYADRDAIT